MSRKECMGKCVNEPYKRGTADRLARGFRACVVCNICYHPDDKTERPKQNSTDCCYCCENKLRVKPVNKKKYNVIIPKVWH